jgi:NhaP-type Na+/H+ and K+/H+ antiporter
MTLVDHIADELGHAARPNDVLALGPITLVVQKVADGRAVTIGLQLAEPDPVEAPRALLARLKRRARAWRRSIRRR